MVKRFAWLFEGLFCRKKDADFDLYENTALWIDVEVNGVVYRVRELSLAQRMYISEYAKENENSPLVISAWLLSVACKEFIGHDVSKLSENVYPSALSSLSDKIIEVSGLHKTAMEEAEKKSESDQN